jgi:uncharacterized membrane protein YqjE
MIRACSSDPPHLRPTLRRLVADLFQLAAIQGELFKVDARRARAQLIKAVAGSAIAMLASLIALASLAATLTLVLYEFTELSLSGASALVTGALFLLALLAAWLGWTAFRRSFDEFGASREELRANARFVKSLLSGDHPRSSDAGLDFPESLRR